MIHSQPDDGLGLLYHVVDLRGQTVDTYRDLSAALRRRDGAQRIFVQEEATKRWLSGAPGTAPAAGSQERAALVSEATVSNFHVLRRACVDGRLVIVSSRLLATGQPVVLLVGIGGNGDEIVYSPFGMLAGAADELLLEDGKFTETAKRVFRRFDSELRSKRHQAYFGTDGEGRPTVAMVRLGKAPPNGVAPQAILIWDDPYELFAPPGQEPAVLLA